MISIDSISTAFTSQLNNDADVRGITEVSAGEYVNVDINRAPWIGVYRGGVKYEPRTLGYNNWEATPSIKVVVQSNSLNSGAECQERLEEYIQKIIVAINLDKTLSNNVEMLNSIAVDYGFIETDRSSLYFQSAIITFEFEVATS